MNPANPRDRPSTLIDLFGIWWDYKLLQDIQLLRHRATLYARLICEHDEGGQLFTAVCRTSDLAYLEPYAALLHAYRCDPLGHVPPVIPVVLRDNAPALFSRSGAYLDHGYPRAKPNPISTYALTKQWSAPEHGRLTFSQVFE